MSPNEKPVPTSPKAKIQAEKELEKLYSSEEDFIKPPKRRVDWITSMIVGLLGGVVGGGALLMFSDELGVSKFFPMVRSEKEIIVRESEEATSEKLQMDQALQTVKGSLVSIYPKEPANAGELPSVLTPFDRKGTAVVMTSDGWLLTTDEVIAFSEISYVAVFSDGAVRDIQTLVTDEADGLVFARVAASDLPVATFAARGDVEVGDPVFVIENPPTSSSYHARPLTIADWSVRPIVSDQDILLFSDSLVRRMQLSSRFQDDDHRSVVVLPGGRVLGFTENTSGSLSVHVPYRIDDVLRQVVETQTVARPSLGILYYDLSDTIGLSSDVTQDQKAGAVLVMGPDTLQSVAARAGLRDRDLVLSVNGEAITERVSLNEAVLKHKKGDVLSLVALRDGQEQTVNVTLE